VAFVLVHHAVFGMYLGAVLAPNHKGMPVRVGPAEDLDWVTRQVTTSRNVRSTPLVDFLFGGVNFQIEHHLFPTMPRPQLRKARPIVIAYCEEVGLRYHEVGVVQSYAEVLAHLATVSRAWRADNRAQRTGLHRAQRTGLDPGPGEPAPE
jgi:fatty acid desaturase